MLYEGSDHKEQTSDTISTTTDTAIGKPQMEDGDPQTDSIDLSDGLEIWYKFNENESGFPVESTEEEVEERGRILIDHSGHGRHASCINPDDIHMIKHSGTVEYPVLPAWEGQTH